jgi:hypothetical protein
MHIAIDNYNGECHGVALPEQYSRYRLSAP